MGDTFLPLRLRRTNRCVSYAFGHATVERIAAEWPGISVSFNLGTIRKMREPLLDSSEPNHLVREVASSCERSVGNERSHRRQCRGNLFDGSNIIQRRRVLL